MTNGRHRQAIQQAFAARESEAPPFAETLQAARARVSESRRGPMLAGAAAILVLAVLLIPRAPEPGLIVEDELLGETWWTAPSDSLLPVASVVPSSDALLPQRRTDIYGEIPALVPSTNPGGETLL